MNRREELIKFVNDEKVTPLIDEFLFIESQMQELRKLPFISVNPKNPQQQKSTPAAKLYKELTQQYTNIFKVLWRVTGADETEEESPLRVWLNDKNLEYREGL